MNVAVYGGSFNPLHIGHLEILRNLVALFDKVLLVVSPRNPLKDIDASGAEARLRAAEAAVLRHPELEGRVEVSDIEFRLPLPSYSIVTLDKLREENPSDRFTMVVGGDQLADFHRWRGYDRILLEYGLRAFPRRGYAMEKAVIELLEENHSYNVGLIEMPLVDISSTDIREKIENGEDVSDLLM